MSKEVEILGGAATVSIGNPNKVIWRIAKDSVGLDLNSDIDWVVIYRANFGRFIAGVEGVAVNDPDNEDAQALWKLWDAKDSGQDYETLFQMFLNMDSTAIDELANVYIDAINERFKAPPELSTPPELLDPN